MGCLGDVTDVLTPYQKVYNFLVEISSRSCKIFLHTHSQAAVNYIKLGKKIQ